MKKICAKCKNWIPLIDNGQCKVDVKLYCEYDDICEKYKKLTYMDNMLRKYGRNK